MKNKINSHMKNAAINRVSHLNLYNYPATAVNKLQFNSKFNKSRPQVLTLRKI